MSLKQIKIKARVLFWELTTIEQAFIHPLDIITTVLDKPSNVEHYKGSSLAGLELDDVTIWLTAETSDDSEYDDSDCWRMLFKKRLLNMRLDVFTNTNQHAAGRTPFIKKAIKTIF